MHPRFEETAAILEARFAEGSAVPWTDDAFGSHAFAVFVVQYESCSVYRSLCDARGITPANLAAWTDIPAVPATAFKYFDFIDDGAGAPEATFRTSGTTRGDEARGRHLVPRLSLYRAALLAPLRAALMPDRGRARFISLIPNPVEVPDSSLSYMVGAAADTLAGGIDWLVDAAGAWSSETEAVCRRAAATGEPVVLLGTALAFQHAIERAARGEPSLGRLPDGSRVMETGGFKGATRHVSRDELHGGITGLTGIPAERIVNEYGMTELLSQLWEPVLVEGLAGRGVHRPAPWLRVRALDPVTLHPVPEGRDGILCFFDLANLGSVAHVLTEDVGSVVDGRVRLRGRAPGAEPRGCSRAMDELMSAAGQP
jgi:hypothetical protein